METKQKYYTEWIGPAAERLHSPVDLTLTIFGQPWLVKAVPYDDGTGPKVRVEFYGPNGRREYSFAAVPENKQFRFSEESETDASQRRSRCAHGVPWSEACHGVGCFREAAGD